MNYEDRVTKEYLENAIAGAGARIVTGMYTGNGADSQLISLAFTPKAVLVTNGSGQLRERESSVYYPYGSLAVTGRDTTLLALAENGFYVRNNGTGTRGNINGQIYMYIAFG